jgi:hypothetical protein
MSFFNRLLSGLNRSQPETQQHTKSEDLSLILTPGDDSSGSDASPPAANINVEQPIRSFTSGMEKLPIGVFAAELLGGAIDEQRETAAKVQSFLMVLDDILKNNIEDTKERRDALFTHINAPELMNETLLNTGIKQENLNERLSAARAIVDEGKGLGSDYESVPPFGAILTNKTLGLIPKATMDTCLVAQLGLRMDALLQGSRDEFSPAKSWPGDDPAVSNASDKFNALLDLRKLHNGIIPEGAKKDQLKLDTINVLDQAATGLDSYPEARGLVTRYVENIRQRNNQAGLGDQLVNSSESKFEGSLQSKEDLFEERFGFKILEKHADLIFAIRPTDTGNEFSFKYDDGRVTVEQNRITAQEFTRPDEKAVAAALMIANAKSQGWKSVAINGKDPEMMENVYIEANLQGIKIDWNKTDPSFQPSDEAKEKLAYRAQRAGAKNVFNNDGSLNLENTFGVSTYVSRAYGPESNQATPELNVPPAPSSRPRL